MFRPSWAVIEEFQVQYNSTYPHAGYPDRLGPSGKFVDSSTELIALKLPVMESSTVQCTSRTSNEAWPEGLNEGTYCKQ